MRVFVRILAGLLGLGLAALGVLLAIEVGWAWLRPTRDPLLVPWRRWREYLDALTWSSTSVRMVAGGLVGVGLLLMLIAATARRRYVRLRDPASEVSVVTSPRSLAHIVERRVREQNNVTSVAVTATAAKIRVRAASGLESNAELRLRLLDIVKSTVDDLPLARTPRVIVVVNSPSDRRR